MTQSWMAANSGGFHFDYADDKEHWKSDRVDNEAVY